MPLKLIVNLQYAIL